MHDLFGTNKTEAVLLVDAENAFNSINRPVFLHNIIRPPIATFVRNFTMLQQDYLYAVVKNYYFTKAQHREIQLQWKFMK